MRVMSVVGARPQFVKLAPIDRAFRDAGIEHIIVHTGQHYDPMLSDVFFTDLGISTPHAHLGIGSGSHGCQTGAMLAALDGILEEHQPDWVLVYGDTNSTLAAALSAVKMHIRVAHLEAGLRSFNRRMPEEHNRVLTDHASDLLLAPTPTAMAHLRHEGLEARSVCVGDVMTDILLAVRDQVAERPSPVANIVSGDGYHLATIHRPDNTDSKERLEKIFDSLAQCADPVILLAHPRLIAKCSEHGITIDRGNLVSHAPLSYPDLIAAACHARSIITDSGGLQKEAFLLRVPTTTVRPETEWVETVDLGWNVLVEPGPDLVRAVQRPHPAPTNATPYGDGNAATAVVQALIRAHKQEKETGGDRSASA